MSKGKDVPPLVAAAAALDEELRALTELAGATKGEPLDGEKSMSRATRALTASVDQQARIEQRLRALVAEIERARVGQQESLDVLVRVAHDVELRTKSRDGLLARFEALGQSAGQVNTLAVELSRRKSEGAGDAEVLERLSAIQIEMAGVVAEADVLADAAKAENWPEIARQADAVRQQVLAAKNKLALAHRNVASRAPS
jgi:hypothetical protein